MTELSQAIGYPIGICQRHGEGMITEDGVPKCMKCALDFARQNAKPYARSIAPDPGVEELKKASPERALAPINVDIANAVKGMVPAASAAVPADFNGSLKAALSALKVAQGQVDDLKTLKKIIKLREQIKILIEE